MKFLYFIAGYILISAVLFIVMMLKCKKNPIFKPPRSPTVFYILSFTWGLPYTIIGFIVAGYLMLSGRKPIKYGWEWCFEFQGLTWGLDLGLIIIAPNNCREDTKMHEHGHGIQNIYFGIFTPFVVSIPSVARFWYRRLRAAIGKPCKTTYSSIWFEGSADESGKYLIQRLKNVNKK